MYCDLVEREMWHQPNTQTKIYFIFFCLLVSGPSTLTAPLPFVGCTKSAKYYALLHLGYNVKEICVFYVVNMDHLIGGSGGGVPGARPPPMGPDSFVSTYKIFKT